MNGRREECILGAGPADAFGTGRVGSTDDEMQTGTLTNQQLQLIETLVVPL